jgi:hypothetical protein
MDGNFSQKGVYGNRPSRAGWQLGEVTENDFSGTTQFRETAASIHAPIGFGRKSLLYLRHPDVGAPLGQVDQHLVTGDGEIR